LQPRLGYRLQNGLAPHPAILLSLVATEMK
jgi:hypothetical protein